LLDLKKSISLIHEQREYVYFFAYGGQQNDLIIIWDENTPIEASPVALPRGFDPKKSEF
jgi:hypothetical protein